MFIGAWVPAEWVQALDRVVVTDDLDRSKVLRRAVKRLIGEVETKEAA